LPKLRVFDFEQTEYKLDEQVLKLRQYKLDAQASALFTSTVVHSLASFEVAQFQLKFPMGWQI